MKVVSVVGARPQFIKAAPTSRAIRSRHEEVLVHTGQHYDRELSEVFFEELSVPEPDHDLAVGSGPHGRQTAEMLLGIDAVVRAESPDAVLVYGDTNSTLAGALSAAKRETALVHVEAGLRSGDMEMPEEVNRRVTDHCSDVLCAPSASAVENLSTEGIRSGVHCTGDVMYDALLSVRDRARSETSIRSDLGLADDEYVLATVHRAANTDDRERLSGILAGLDALPYPVVFPAHPRTVEALERFDLYDRASSAMELIDPVGYLSFLALVDGAWRVATDSGGVQKEAFYLDTPCVTLRDRTEWVETVECGWNVLVGADPERIYEGVTRGDEPTSKPPLYGEGDAAENVLEALDDVG